MRVSPQNLDIYDQPADGKDYILQVKIKNGPLLRAIRMRGFANANQFCLTTGMSATVVGKYLSLQSPPISRNGHWRPSVLHMAKHLRLPPEALFPEQHLQHALAKASGEIEISREEVLRLIEHNDPDAAERREELSAAIERVMQNLTPREERVLRLTHGFNGEPKTLGDVAKDMNVSAARAAQIANKAYRKLRRPKNLKALSDAGCVAAEDLRRKKVKEVQQAKEVEQAQQAKETQQANEARAEAAIVRLQAMQALLPEDDDGSIARQLMQLPLEKLLRLAKAAA